MKRCSFAFYNIAPPSPTRGPVVVRRELTAIATPNPERRRPKVIGVCEAVGHHPLPELERYNLVSSTENLSKANVALYIRDDLSHGEPFWTMHTEKWIRPKHPHADPHEPRATLHLMVENWRVIVAHAPQAPQPHNPDFTPAINHSLEVAREEWLKVVVGLMDREGDGPVLVLSDPNGLKEELGQQAHARDEQGDAGQAVHVRGGHAKNFIRLPEVNGVPMGSDHQLFIRGTGQQR